MATGETITSENNIHLANTFIIIKNIPLLLWHGEEGHFSPVLTSRPQVHTFATACSAFAYVREARRANALLCVTIKAEPLIHLVSLTLDRLFREDEGTWTGIFVPGFKRAFFILSILSGWWEDARASTYRDSEYGKAIQVCGSDWGAAEAQLPPVLQMSKEKPFRSFEYYCTHATRTVKALLKSHLQFKSVCSILMFQVKH